MNADELRERSTGELLKEQVELSKLRRRAILNKNAWWSWNRDEYAFTVSKAWEELTGYEAGEHFPQNLSRNIPIESWLDELVENWLEIVSEEDRPQAKKAGVSFLLNTKGGRLDFSYFLIKKDGSRLLVLSEGNTVWKNELLQEVFVTIRDIDRHRDSRQAAVTIEKHEEKLEDNADAIQTLKKNLGNISTSLALVATTLVAFNDVIVSIKDEVFKVIAVWRPPGIPAEIPSPELLPDSISPEALSRAEEIIIEEAPPGLTSVKLVSYSKGKFPDRWQVVSEIDYEIKESHMLGSRLVTESIETSSKVNLHVAKQPFQFSSDGVYKYSVPFHILLEDGEEQIFYIELSAKTPNLELLEKIEYASINIATQLARLFQQ